MLAVVEHPPQRIIGEAPALYEFWNVTRLTKYISFFETAVEPPRPIYYVLVEALGPDAGRYCRTISAVK